jgi:hypothetical protein
MKLRKKNMIKWLIEKIFGKFCKCKDEHLAMYEDVLKPEIKIVCDKHPDSYKKTCPSCRAAK